MRKIILMAVAGYLWKKFKARQTGAAAQGNAARSFDAAVRQRTQRTADFR